MKMHIENIREKCEKGLWYIFVFLLPWQTVWILREVFVSGEKWQYGTISVYLFEIVLFVWLIFLFFRKQEKVIQNQQRAKKNTKKLFWTGMFFLVWVFISVFWAEDMVLALSYFGIFLLGFGLLWGMSQSAIHFRKTVLIFLISFSLYSVIGIGQFLFQESPGITILGMSRHNPQEAGTSVLKGDCNGEPTRMLRAYGGMTHPNVFGGVLAVGVLLALWLWVNARSLWERVCAPVFVFAGLLALLLTFSRSAWLGCMFGFFLFLSWLFVRRKNWRRRTIPIFIFVIIVLSFFGMIFREEVASRFQEKTIVLEGSVRDRARLMRDAFAIWKQHPMVGVGIGNGTLAMMQKEHGENPLQKNIPVWEYQPAHNIFLWALVELGVVGLVLFLYCIFQFFRLSQSILWGKDSRKSVILASFLALVPLALFDHWLWTSHFGILFFFFLFGLLFFYKK